MSEGHCQFFVPGTPRPAGSKKAFKHKRLDRIIVTDMSGHKGKVWRKIVQAYCHQNFNGPPWEGAVHMEYNFVLQRPKSHFGTGKNSERIKAKSPHYHLQKPDVLKLARAVEDALSGCLFKDDCTTTTIVMSKIWHPVHSDWDLGCKSRFPGEGVEIVARLQPEGNYVEP